MRNTNRSINRAFLTFAASAIALSFAVVDTSAHNVKGLEYQSLSLAHVKSPTLATDQPIPIFGTGVSVVCFDVQNRSPYNALITAVGLELPGEFGEYNLVYSESPAFHLESDVSLVPYYPERTLDFAFLTGPRFNSDGGKKGLPPVVQPSNEYTTFCAAGQLPAGMSIENLLNFVWVRFRRVGPEGNLSDIGIWERAPIP